MLYNKTVTETGQTNGTLDTTKIPAVLDGIGSSWTRLWSFTEDSAQTGRSHQFENKRTYVENNQRFAESFKAICVSK